MTISASVRIGLVVAVVFQPCLAAAQQGWARTVTDLTTPYLPYLTSVSPRLWVAPSGRATVVWQRVGGDCGAVEVAESQLPHGDWSTPLRLSDCGGFNPRVSGDRDGNLAVAWTRGDVQRFVEVVQYSTAAEVWSSPRTLSDVDGNATLVQLAGSSAGDVAVLWRRNISPDVTALDVARYSAGSRVWTAPREIVPAGSIGDARMTIDSDGDIIVAWSESPELKARRYLAGTDSWQPAVSLASGRPDRYLAIASHEDGSAMLAWSESGGGLPPTVHAVRFDKPTATWGTPQPLSEPGGQHPDVAVHSDGDAIVVWQFEDPATHDDTIRAAKYLHESAAWTPSVKLAQGLTLWGPGVRIDSLGNVFVWWTRPTLGNLGSDLEIGRYSLEGQQLAPVVRVNQYRYTDSGQVAFDRYGNAAVVWRGYSGIHPPLPDYRIQSSRWLATPLAPTITNVRSGVRNVAVYFAAPATTESAFAATTYEYSIDGGATWLPRSPASSASPLSLSGLTFPGSYTIQLRARNRAGPGSVWATTAANTQVSADPPSDLKVVGQSGRLVSLSWLPAPGGYPATDYVVEGGLSPGEALASLSTGDAAPNFTFSVPPGVYHLRVIGVFDGGWSEPSNDVELFVEQPLVPSAPANVLASVNGADVALSWTNTWTRGTPTGLRLVVDGASSGAIPLSLTETASFAHVPPGTYTVRLTATNPYGESAPSNAVTVTVPDSCTGAPGVPTRIQVWTIGRRVHVAWSPPDQGAPASSYVLQITGSYAGIIETPSREVSADAADGAYGITIAGRNSCGTGPPSAVQSVRVPWYSPQ